MTQVLLLSTYELGHQPFGLASPAAWLKARGARVSCLDLAVHPLDEALAASADLIAIYLPMHTATRLAVGLIPRLRAINPHGHFCCYGLYAPLNESYLRQLGVNSVLGGEFESGLSALYDQIANGSINGKSAGAGQSLPIVALNRQQFLVPDRGCLPRLNDYAQVVVPDGSVRKTGYTEATRGCKHLCRHCPIVPIYNGRFRIVQSDVVLADIRQQVEAGAQHITFGDPDFLNGPGHAMPLVHALHTEFPDLTYDVTIKIEHLLKHDQFLPVLRETGCLFITSAVEAVDNYILDLLDKGHTRADFERVVRRLREIDLSLNPTFVPFTPWTTPGGYLDLLATIRDLDLVNNISPIQYAIRLLIPNGSRLLELTDIAQLVGPFNPRALAYPWKHPDPIVDQLYEEVFRLVKYHQVRDDQRQMLFAQIWRAALDSAPELAARYTKENTWDFAARPVPRLSESWY